MKPQPDQFATRAEYAWARKNWKRRHGGSFFGTLAIALFFGALSGSVVVLMMLVALAVVGTLVARSRP